jgi:hypothetical protein
MDEFGNIVVIELEILQPEQMFNVLEISCDQVIHGYHAHSFFDEPVAKVGT